MTYYYTIIEDCISYVENNLEHELSVQEISEKFFFSKFHFYRIFKAFTSYSLTEYIDRRRMTKAVKLLINEDYNVLETALMCGYNSHEVFSRKFKKEYGVSPSKFRLDPFPIESFDRLDVIKREFVNRNNDVIINYKVIEIKDIFVQDFVKKTFDYDLSEETSNYMYNNNSFRWFSESVEESPLYLMIQMDYKKEKKLELFFGYENIQDDEFRFSDLVIPSSRYVVFYFENVSLKDTKIVTRDIHKCIMLENLVVEDTPIQVFGFHKDVYGESTQLELYVPIK